MTIVIEIHRPAQDSCNVTHKPTSLQDEPADEQEVAADDDAAFPDGGVSAEELKKMGVKFENLKVPGKKDEL